MVRSREVGELLLGEWACLACLVERPSHGFGVAQRLASADDLGGPCPLSRPLTYRSLDQLLARGLVEVVGEERGRNGGTRTVFGATAAGRELLDSWLVAPVAAVQAIRSELVLKVVVTDRLDRDRTPLVAAQRQAFAALAAACAAGDAAPGTDPAAVWQEESVAAAGRFLDRLA